MMNVISLGAGVQSSTMAQCDLVGCTFGPGTDIRSRWVCDAWEKTEEAQG